VEGVDVPRLPHRPPPICAVRRPVPSERRARALCYPWTRGSAPCGCAARALLRSLLGLHYAGLYQQPPDLIGR
jgi:hypothetical protein